MESRHFEGYEPFDLLNSPYLSGTWARQLPPAILLIQFGKRFAGRRLRQLLKVPQSRNPKALGLCLSAYCDLARSGCDVSAEAAWLKGELIRLRSPHESYFSWGYDWDYLSLRGSRLPAFSPNCIASYFCGTAMLEMSQVFGDQEALEIAESTAGFMASRLNRSFESADEICFSYTPNDKTLIYNSSALAGVFLARTGKPSGNKDYLSLARKAMAFLVRGQLPAGGWYYGQLRRQRWIDNFHTSYNVCALLDYQQTTGDRTFEEAMLAGHRYYQSTFFSKDGTPRYYHNRTFPIDIHACSQAILHFTAFSAMDPAALPRSLKEQVCFPWELKGETCVSHPSQRTRRMGHPIFGGGDGSQKRVPSSNIERARKTFHWTLGNMAAPDGSFYYQRHRLWTNRTPYMRWGQAWMLRALARLQLFSGSFATQVGL
jgi:hypothetical protein